MKRVIFGGSFDPPTLAHYDMGVKLSEYFDETIVVPAFISPFKNGGAELSGNERLKLLKRLFAGNDKITVSDTELKAGGTSYSYMTAEKFYNPGDELYIAIGSDGLGSLDKWARTDILGKIVTFYVVERPYFSVRQTELDRAREILKVEVAPFIGKEGSSSLLRVAVAFGKAGEVVPPVVAGYIGKRGLYRDYDYIVSRYPEFDMKQSRAEHIYRTTKAAILLAKLNGVSTDKAIKAALYHDIGKYATREKLADLGIAWTNEIESLPESCRHQLTGAAIAKKCFGETDPDILAAIATHTTGAKNMSALQKVIFAADYIEEGRDFDGLDEIRAITYDNLDNGVKAILKNTISYLERAGQSIAPVTKQAYEYMISKKGEY